MTTIRLVIPDCPKSMNRSQMRTHWAVAQREKKRWQELFETELMVHRASKGMKFCTVQVHVEWKKKRRRDVSNWYGPITKPLYDALVSGGYLEDDTAEFVALKGITFEEPEEWPYRDPRLLVRMTVTLEAEYPERSVDAVRS